MDDLEFLYSRKGNVSRIFEACKAFHRPEKQDRSLSTKDQNIGNHRYIGTWILRIY